MGHHIRIRAIYLNEPSIAVNGAVQCNILIDILDFFNFRFAENFQEIIYAQRYLLEKLAEMFLNTFHRKKMFEKWRGKKLLRKNSSKNFAAGFLFYYYYFCKAYA